MCVYVCGGGGGGHKHDSSNGVCMGITNMTVVMVCVGGSQA